MELKNVRRGRVKELADKFENVEFFEGARPWGVKADVALPCATQNELNGAEAEMLVNNGAPSRSSALGFLTPGTLIKSTNRFTLGI